MHGKLVEGHILLMNTYVELTKMVHAEDHTPYPETSKSLALDDPNAYRIQPVSDKSHLYSKADYPDVCFWSRMEWLKFKNQRKDSSGLFGSEAGPRGGTRCAQGKNVSMQYLEHPNGEAIDGRLAADIQEHARTIWADFYD